MLCFVYDQTYYKLTMVQAAEDASVPGGHIACKDDKKQNNNQLSEEQEKLWRQDLQSDTKKMGLA